MAPSISRFARPMHHHVHRRLSIDMGSTVLDSLAAGEHSGLVRASQLIGIHDPAQKMGDLRISFRTDWDDGFGQLLNRFHELIGQNEFAQAAHLLTQGENRAVLRHQQKDLSLMWMILASDQAKSGPGASATRTTQKSWEKAIELASRIEDAELVYHLQKIRNQNERPLEPEN